MFAIIVCRFAHNFDKRFFFIRRDLQFATFDLKCFLRIGGVSIVRNLSLYFSWSNETLFALTNLTFWYKCNNLHKLQFKHSKTLNLNLNLNSNLNWIYHLSLIFLLFRHKNRRLCRFACGWILVWWQTAQELDDKNETATNGRGKQVVFVCVVCLVFVEEIWFVDEKET